MARTSPKKISSTGAKAGKKAAKVLRSSTAGRLVVSPRAGNWVVKRVGANRERVFVTKADAVKAATKTARDSKSEVVIKGMDGKIKEVSSSRADSLMLDVWKDTRQPKGGSSSAKSGAGSSHKKA
jgi:hypothetical protein